MQNRKKLRRAVSRILVPTDFSDCSAAALEFAVTLAKPFHAALILVHVIEPLPYNGMEGLMLIDYQPLLKSRAKALLDRLSKLPLKENLPVATHLTDGIPFREIINLAKREKADLIVIGTHGRTGFDHLLTGSVAEKVVRLSTCPVVAVHSQPAVPRRKGMKRKRKAEMGSQRG